VGLAVDRPHGPEVEVAYLRSPASLSTILDLMKYVCDENGKLLRQLLDAARK
jgi:hypothetical protein